MSYSGEVYRVLCNQGGLNLSANEGLLPVESIVEGSKNINLIEGGRRKRGGTSIVNASAISGTPVIKGLYDFNIPGGAFIMMATDDGKIWRNSSTVLKTGLTTSRFSNFETFDKEVVICNGADLPQTWDGSAGATQDIGIDPIEVPDEPAVILYEIDAPSTSPTIALAQNGAGNLTNGAYEYQITYKTAAGETVGGTTVEITVVSAATNGQVILTSIPISSEENVTQRKIYRTIADGSALLLAATITNNTETLHIDNVADASLGAAIPTVNKATAGNLNNGVYKYKITYTNVSGETTGSEYDPITVSDKTIVGQVEVTGISTGGAGITSRKIYRTIVGGASYLLAGTLSDNTTTTYIDNTADGSLGAGIPTTNTALAIPADWSGSSYPVQSKTHGRGNSTRLWFVGCSATPYTVYVSPTGNKDALDDERISVFVIDTGDAYGIVGMTALDDKLVCFGKAKAYIIDDADVDSSNWGYIEAPWKGGVSSSRLIVETPTDVICMTDEGEIYSVRAAQKFGDYGHASLIRQSFIDKWIKDNVRLAYIENFHGVYDPVLRAVKFFVVRNGETTCDTALVYFLDRGPVDGWIIHDNLDSTSGYNAASSALIRVGAGQYEVYTGGYAGYMWKTEQSTRNDESNSFYAGFLTPNLDFDNPRTKKNFKQGFVIAAPQSDETIKVQIKIDGVALALQSFDVTELVKNYHFNIGANGKRISFEVYNDTVDEDFFISQILTDFKELGARTE